MMILNCTGRRLFSKPKRIENEMRNRTGQKRLNMSLMSNENEVLHATDFVELVNEFATVKAHRQPL